MYSPELTSKHLFPLQSSYSFAVITMNSFLPILFASSKIRFNTSTTLTTASTDNPESIASNRIHLSFVYSDLLSSLSSLFFTKLFIALKILFPLVLILPVFKKFSNITKHTTKVPLNYFPFR